MFPHFFHLCFNQFWFPNLCCFILTSRKAYLSSKFSAANHHNIYTTKANMLKIKLGEKGQKRRKNMNCSIAKHINMLSKQGWLRFVIYLSFGHTVDFKTFETSYNQKSSLIPLFAELKLFHFSPFQGGKSKLWGIEQGWIQMNIWTSFVCRSGAGKLCPIKPTVLINKLLATSLLSELGLAY